MVCTPLFHSPSFLLTLSRSTCLISVLRLAFIYPIAVSPDLTWQTPLAVIWSCVETNVAIICSCIPTLKGLVQRFFPRLLDSLRSQQPEVEEFTSSQASDDSVQKAKKFEHVSEKSIDCHRHR